MSAIDAGADHLGNVPQLYFVYPQAPVPAGFRASFNPYPPKITLPVGQRQLVCLARALLRNTRLLLLDEATSQMDGDTDSLIQRTLRESFAKCTLFTIAHRLHTVLDYDKILVMEDGRVREFGAVSALLDDPGSAFHAMAFDSGVLSGEDLSSTSTTAL